MRIPKIIHQTWKTREIPDKWHGYQQNWKSFHPDWDYRFWTDDDIREFILQKYSWFLPAYDAYPEMIYRVDAFRYFVIYHYGGVYVDLDFECLRPLGGLLEDKQLVLGIEPATHSDFPSIRARGFHQIICNAFIASVPSHPFWEHVFRYLVDYQHASSVLDATSYVLTRAYDTFPNKASMSILSPEWIYPIDHLESWSGKFNSAHARQQLAKTAFAVHYWHGSWWRDSALNAVRKRIHQSRERNSHEK